MAQYLNRGSPVFIEGRLKLDQWEDKNGGGKPSNLFDVDDNIQFINSGQGGQGTGGGSGGNYARSGAGGGGGGGGNTGGGGGEVAINHDDIPF
jgi:single-strand DNA-binding protein